MNHRNVRAILFAGFIAAQLNITSAQATTITTNANWAWMKGANFTDQTGTYGTQGTAASANKPGARDSAVTWTDGAGALWLFGGDGYDASTGTSELNDLWKYDQATTNWTWMKGANIRNESGTYGTQGMADPTNTPGARLSAVSWMDGAGALWLFGGLGRDSAGSHGNLNDLWKFDPVTTNWTWMKGADTNYQSGTYGAQGTAAPANTPGARYGAVSWTDGAGALWLFGGYGSDAAGSSGNLNDLWKYDPATTNWTWIKGSTNINQQGIYGTQGVPAAGNTPGARAIAVSWTDGDGALWLFGGYGSDASGSSGNLNDLWKYDPATTNWTWIKGSTNINQHGIYGTQGVPAAGNTPGARALWLFGGNGFDAAGNSDALNDLWKFDPATMNWTWIKGANAVGQYGTYGTRGLPAPANKPGVRESAVSWMDGTGALWLFGGNGYATSGGMNHLNDLWKLDILGGISLDTQALVFSATHQGANPAVQAIGMINVGGTAFTYTNVIAYSAGAAGWLTVLPAAGTVAPNGTIVLTNQINIAGLAAGTYYATNQVAADATNSPQNVVITLTVHAVNPPPPAPTGVSATDGTYMNKVLVSWNAVSGATSYEVWRHTSNNSGAASKISSPDPTGTSYADTSVAAGCTYYYWLKAVNAAGASDFSSPVCGFLGVVGPLITANGLVGEVQLNSGDPATIAVQMMNIEPYLGVEVDWWVVVFAHAGGWYYLDNAMQWTAFSGDLALCRPVYQGPLMNLPSTPVLNGYVLPRGTYDFWFAVSYPMSGILNPSGQMLFDQATVVVQ